MRLITGIIWLLVCTSCASNFPDYTMYDQGHKVRKHKAPKSHKRMKHGGRDYKQNGPGIARYNKHKNMTVVVFFGFTNHFSPPK